MGLALDYDEGQTPLSEEEKDGLLIPTVTTKGELDEVEQRNIETAIQWTLTRRKRFTIEEILTEAFIKEVHSKMFSSVWSWAGSFRNSEKNIGISSFRIGIELKTLLDDCKYWIENETYGSDEIDIHFKHRIVSIHCFSNGNGRHSRLLADIIIKQLFGGEVFTWGSRNLIQKGDYRKLYLKALQAADAGNYGPLIEFSRS